MEFGSLADFYRTLPVVSASLYRAIWGNRKLGSAISNLPWKALAIAKKLQHPILFREALIYVVSDYTTWENLDDWNVFENDEKLKNTAFRAHARLCALKMRADHEILKLARDVGKVWQTIRDDGNFPDGSLRGAYYYRNLLQTLEDYRPHYTGVQEPIQAIEALLKSNLELDRRVAGEGSIMRRECFYCAEIADRDMPWDRKETNW
jgi:hypothetical protein